MKHWAKSRTVWLGIGVGLLGGLQVGLESNPMPEPWGGLVVMGIGGAVVMLRKLTTQPIGGADG
jgi:hypothetical protein